MCSGLQAFRVAWLALVWGVASGAELRVVGSDLFGLEFTKSFYAFVSRARVPVALTFEGSRPALEQLKAGRADIGVLILPREEAGSLAGFEAVPVGYLAVAVLVPVDCPLERISFAQLGKIFGGNQGVHWSELGAAAPWADDLVAPLLPEVGTGLALDCFRHVVLRDGSWRREIPRYRDSADLAAQFARPSRLLAVAAAGAIPADSKTKLLPVASDAAGPAVLPTAEILYAGRYPIALAVQLVFRAERRADAARLGEFILGEEAAALLQPAGIVALPPAGRAKQQRALMEKQKAKD